MKSGRGAEGSSAAAKEVVPRAPVALKKGPWTAEEDAILREYVKKHGEGNWNAVQKNHGLNRCGKSCRLRWTNHLRPDLKKGAFSPEEEVLILHFHAKFGNKWARISTYLPGRTDNEIKNYWNTRLKRRQRGGLPPYPLEMEREFLLRHGYHLHPSANSSSASPVPAPLPPPLPLPLPLPLPPTLPPASALPTPLRPPPLSLREPITLPSSPSPAMAAAFSPSLPLLAQNQFSSALSFQFPLSSPPSPLSLALAQQLSVSCPASPSPQSPLLQPQLQQPLPHSLGSFDLNPPPCFTQVPLTGELPSSQMLGETGGGSSSSDGLDMLWSSGRTGLLDDVVREAQRLRVDLPSELVPAAGGQDGNWHGNLGGNDDVSKGSTFSPAQGSVLESFSMPDGSDYSINGIEMRNEATNKINPAHGDIATLSDMMLAPTVPATTVVPTMPATTVALDRHNSDSGEISNGPSSVVTDDDMGLDMHQLTSSYAVAPKEQEWVINPSTWNDMSGIR